MQVLIPFLRAIGQSRSQLEASGSASSTDLVGKIGLASGIHSVGKLPG